MGLGYPGLGHSVDLSVVCGLHDDVTHNGFFLPVLGGFMLQCEMYTVERFEAVISSFPISKEEIASARELIGFFLPVLGGFMLQCEMYTVERFEAKINDNLEQVLRLKEEVVKLLMVPTNKPS
ncbi:hypothetical protein SO802_011355 [Lithocarpus litseifolius]|uniref:Uncharacterized protein n=1 Tax=Lithocarpus litseifolius TaxID=425828 RepID=A0AAW2D0F5_9ROSI